MSVYGAPGAFAASIGWYLAGAGSVAASLAERAPDPADRIAVPTTGCGPNTIRCSPVNGPTGSASASADRGDSAWLGGAGHFDGLLVHPPQGMSSPLDRRGRAGRTRATRLAKTVESLHAGKRAR